MKIKEYKAPASNGDGEIYFILVEINEVEREAIEMIDHLKDTSWIDRMGVVSREAFKAMSDPTIRRMVDGIANRNENEVTLFFGEFVVSLSAQKALGATYKHTAVPLAELIKEKILGNPGFDFHTETGTSLIAFGEAKYSGVANSHGKAMRQIVRFIEENKDSMELVTLEKFVSSKAIKNTVDGYRAYTAAFSIAEGEPEKAFTSAEQSDHIKRLAEFPELYLVGVIINVS